MHLHRVSGKWLSLDFLQVDSSTKASACAIIVLDTGIRPNLNFAMAMAEMTVSRCDVGSEDD